MKIKYEQVIAISPHTDPNYVLKFESGDFETDREFFIKHCSIWSEFHKLEIDDNGKIITVTPTTPFEDEFGEDGIRDGLYDEFCNSVHYKKGDELLDELIDIGQRQIEYYIKEAYRSGFFDGREAERETNAG